MAQLEPHEKVLVSKEFLKTTHGQSSCIHCHGGDPRTTDKVTAHKGRDAYPSLNHPDKTCGECHEDIVKTAATSLHTTLSTFPATLMDRADPNKWSQINEARSKHCAACHTNSCGGCHVSRPQYAKKGFINGHMFSKKSDPINQCTACHGSRIGGEFYGRRGAGDVHVSKYNMDCSSCHKAAEMHASGIGLSNRYHLEEMVNCLDCHKGLEHGSVRDHSIHIGKVQCQVCHSQTYVNCYSCHTGRDEDGLYYFQNQREVEDMKIGLNYDKTAPGADYDFMLVRHIPVDPDLFASYVENAQLNFDRLPTWKRTSPHNIQRHTWQNANCNNCHDNKELFLRKDDLLDYEIKANRNVVVPDNKIPPEIEQTQPFHVDTGEVRNEKVVDVYWLHNNLARKKLVIIDARSESDYEQGHIKGSISFSPLENDLQTDTDADRPMTLVSQAELAEIIGEAGLSDSDHIVVYDQDGRLAGYLAWVLQVAGINNISYLKGGVDSWHAAGFPFSTEEFDLDGQTGQKFNVKPNLDIIADNAFVKKNLDNPRTVIIDVRPITYTKGMLKHGEASRAGRIPGAVSFPVSALYMDNGELKSVEELLWMLKKNGITPDKTVITTCNTGQLAGAAYFILHYLGYNDVRVHDDSWVGWSMTE